MKADRIPCCVPHCNRTAAASKHPESEEIICAKHWRRIPLAIRRYRKTLDRRGQKLVAAHDKRLRGLTSFTEADLAFDRRICEACAVVDRLWARNWQRCKSAAIGAI